MKYVVVFLVALISVSCMDSILHSNKKANRRNYPPEKVFEGKELLVGKAIYDGNAEEVERLIKEEKIDINHISKNGECTFLMYACLLEDMEVMEKLLSLGCDPNLASPMQSSFDTPVGHATAIYNIKMLELLLKYKATLNPTIGDVPLNEAMFLGDEKHERPMIDFLLNHGANLNYYSYANCHLILNNAMIAGGIETVNYFLDKGADPLLKGPDGENLACILTKDIEYMKKIGKTEAQYPEYLELKKRLEREYHIKFPVKKDTLYPYEFIVKGYQKLSSQDKQLLGKDWKIRYEHNLQELSGLKR